jgi:hypothetical protein
MSKPWEHVKMVRVHATASFLMPVIFAMMTIIDFWFWRLSLSLFFLLLEARSYSSLSFSLWLWLFLLALLLALFAVPCEEISFAHV